MLRLTAQLLLLLAYAEALRRPGVASVRRVRDPQLQFPSLPNFGGGPKPPPDEEEEKPDLRSAERRRFEDEQTGFLFFQPATPRTGVQDGRPDFFAGQETGELGLLPKGLIATATILFLWLVVTLILA